MSNFLKIQDYQSFIAPVLEREISVIDVKPYLEQLYAIHFNSNPNFARNIEHTIERLELPKEIEIKHIHINLAKKWAKEKITGIKHEFSLAELRSQIEKLKESCEERKRSGQDYYLEIRLIEVAEKKYAELEAIENNLDTYCSTKDQHFNHNIQNWYFQFSGSNKPETNTPFLTLCKAVLEIYSFAIEQPTKPFKLIERAKEIFTGGNYPEADQVLIIDKVLGIISNHPEADSFAMPFIQLVDFRHDLSPWNEDPEILQFADEYEDQESQSANHDEVKPEKTFENYLTPEGIDILPFLISEFKNIESPQAIFNLLCALSQLSLLLDNNILKYKVAPLHRALEATFGRIGVRQGLNKVFSNYNAQSLDPNAEAEVRAIVKRIMEHASAD